MIIARYSLVSFYYCIQVNPKNAVSLENAKTSPFGSLGRIKSHLFPPLELLFPRFDQTKWNTHKLCQARFGCGFLRTLIRR